MPNRIRPLALVAFTVAAASTVSCSSATDSTPPVAEFTHPAGNITDTVVLRGNPHAIAIARDGTMLISRLDSFDVVSGRDSELVLGPLIHVGPTPVDIAISPDSRTAFVPLIGTPHVAIIDVRTSTKTGQLTIFPDPERALVTPDGSRVYITTTGSEDDTLSTVYDFDAHSHVLLDSILTGKGGNGIAFDSATDRLYVTGVGNVYEIDASADTVTRLIPVTGILQDIGLTPDGSELWVATEDDAGVQVFDLVTGAFKLSVPGTAGAFGMKITPDGKQVYLTRNSFRLCAIIDATTHQVLKSFSLGGDPKRIAFNKSGSRAVMIDAETGAVLIQ